MATQTAVRTEYNLPTIAELNFMGAVDTLRFVHWRDTMVGGASCLAIRIAERTIRKHGIERFQSKATLNSLRVNIQGAVGVYDILNRQQVWRIVKFVYSKLKGE
jgi:hypothetical protein